MPRLLRPHIPLDVRCRVVLRQLGEMWPEVVLAHWRKEPGGLGAFLKHELRELAEILNCEVKALHLDHDPALGSREKVFRKGQHVGYKPDANDPEHLYYREAVAHRLKTNVRGLHGQHPDRVLIKKNRRLEKKAKKPTFKQTTRAIASRFGFRPDKLNPKRKWAKRPLKSASRWPAKGTQKIRRRP